MEPLRPPCLSRLILPRLPPHCHWSASAPSWGPGTSIPTAAKAVLELLIDGEPLPAAFKDHPLRGNFAGSRDCHIEPDWVLIYTLTEENTHVRFERTGTHSDLFR